MEIKIRRRTLKRIDSIATWMFILALFILLAGIPIILWGVTGVVIVIIGIIVVALFVLGVIRIRITDDRGKDPKNGGRTDK